MSGFLQRLLQRGQGGAALSRLPVVRPAAAIYGGGDRDRTDRDLDAGSGAPDVPGAFVAAAPRGRPDKPAGVAPASSGPLHPASMPRTEPHAETRDPRSGKPASGTENEAGRHSHAVADPGGHPHEDVQHASRPVAQPTDIGSVPDLRVQGAAPHVILADAPPSAQRREAPPARPRSGLEGLFHAIEESEDGGVAPAPARPALRDGGGSSPTVSIGRITISVAPPPAPRSGPSRSLGFADYARLRGGYER